MLKFNKALGYSEESSDIFVGLLELDYRRTSNPMCVWNAILRMDKIGMTRYPAWVSEYLVQSAKNLKTCKPTPKGENGIVAAFKLKGNLLYEEDIDLIILIDQLMREKVRKEGMDIEDAANVTEIELYDKGEESLVQSKPEPGHRGRYGNSRIEKLYRELRKADKDE